MNLQLDMFAAGETDTLPPWIDPALCSHYQCDVEIDADHVGLESVGCLGNNSSCLVVRAMSHAGEPLRAWRYEASEARAAWLFRDAQERELRANQQQRLL